MKTRHFFAFLASIILLSTQTIKADEITIEAKNTDISENLELTAVANLFGQAKNLEDFEMQLNDSENKFSNLDLNNDGEVDYLRIVEEVKNDLHIIIIQAVLAPDIYQDVATILVEKEKKNRKTSVQVIGDPYIYGNNYIIEPVFIYTPIIYDYFWATYYHPWHSPYYWGYFPPYYHHHHCIYAHLYRRHIYAYNRHHHCSYRYAHAPKPAYKNVTPANSRRDYASANPSQSFSSRHSNSQIQNKRSLQIANRNQSTRTTRPAVSSSRSNSSSTVRNGNSSVRNSAQTNNNRSVTIQRNTSTQNRNSVSSNRNSIPQTSRSSSSSSTNRSSYTRGSSTQRSSTSSSYNSNRSSSSSPSRSSGSISRGSSSSSRSSSSRR